MDLNISNIHLSVDKLVQKNGPRKAKGIMMRQRLYRKGLPNKNKKRLDCMIFYFDETYGKKNKLF